MPSAAVVVATARALKMHGGLPRDRLASPDVEAVRRGLVNLEAHAENVRQLGVPVVVAVNHFDGDTDAELDAALGACRDLGVPARVSRVWALGGRGGVEVAGAVLEALAADGSKFRYLYPDDLPLARKMDVVATALYGAGDVDVTPAAASKVAQYEQAGFGRLPVCMAKTQHSLSDDARKLGRPRGFRIAVRDAKLAAGAGFVVAYAGDILTLPGLPKEPAAESIDLDPQGNVVGLF